MGDTPRRIDPYYVQEDDNLDEMAETLKPALDFTDADLARLSPEAKNLFSGRRHLGIGWLDAYEIVVTVTKSPSGCACGVREGQTIVFDMRHKVKPELSDAPLCVHLMSPVLSIFYMTFDRAAEGLNPLTCIWRYIECPITGTDEGASKALAEVHIRRADTHEPVTQRMLAQGAR
ncbi:hypothetical protein [Amorphus sp. 3PC139-8]|uniref:hypothetical protein n=1 Tax=Amorphus sp. 3PC139-8 TaxID=2735676 RepID=UPI00345CCB9F